MEEPAEQEVEHEGEEEDPEIPDADIEDSILQRRKSRMREGEG